MELVPIISAVISGGLLGGFYGIIAIGVTLNWGLLKIINIAHFSFFLFAAYLTYQFSVSTGYDPFLSLVITMPLFFLIGVALQWFFEFFKIEEFVSLLITFGLFSIFESIMREIWTADNRPMPTELVPYKAESLLIGPFYLRLTHLGAFIVAIVIAVATWYFLNRTYAGKALRAFAQDKAIAAAFGVNHLRLSLLLGGISGMYAAIAGAFFAVIFQLQPEAAVPYIGIIFAVVILGGLGNTVGAFAAGVIVGVVQSVTSAIPALGPGFAPLVTFSLLIFVVLFKPEGLFTRSST